MKTYDAIYQPVGWMSGQSSQRRGSVHLEMLAPLMQGRMERLEVLKSKVEAGEAFNARTAADEFGTSTKTIHRDLGFLRETLGLRFHYDKPSHAFVPGQQLKGDGK